MIGLHCYHGNNKSHSFKKYVSNKTLELCEIASINYSGISIFKGNRFEEQEDTKAQVEDTACASDGAKDIGQV